MSSLSRLLAIIAFLFSTTSAFGQFKEDTTESNQEGYIMYNSHLSAGFGSFQAEGFESTPGFSYEAGVSAKYVKGSSAYEVSLMASSRCASIPEAAIEGLRLTYLLLSPSVWRTQGIFTGSVGMGLGVPIRAGSKTHSVVHRIPLSNVGPLYELRGKLELDLTNVLPFDVFVLGTYPLNQTGLIEGGDVALTGRSSTLQFGFNSR